MKWFYSLLALFLITLTLGGCTVKLSNPDSKIIELQPYPTVINPTNIREYLLGRYFRIISRGELYFTSDYFRFIDTTTSEEKRYHFQYDVVITGAPPIPKITIKTGSPAITFNGYYQLDNPNIMSWHTGTP